jgi:hypothetical protein
MASRSASRTVVAPFRCLRECPGRRRPRVGNGAAGTAKAPAWPLRRGSAAGSGAGSPFASERQRMSEAAFAFFQQHGDRRVDLHVLGAFGDHDLADHAFVDGFDFHGRLVGFDFGDHVAGGNLSPSSSAIWPACPLPWSGTAQASEYQSAWCSLPLQRNVGVELGRIRLRIVLGEVGGSVTTSRTSCRSP